MYFRSVILGTIVTILLISVIASTHVFEAVEEEETLLITDVDIVEIEPPPPPPELPEEEPEPTETATLDPPPSAPLLDLPIDAPQADVPEVSTSLTSVPLTTPLTQFHTEVGVSKIPVKPAPPKKVYKKPSSPSTVKKTYVKPTVKPKPKVVIKSIYNTNELDRTPSLRKTGRFVWPSRARGTSGTVKLKLEINTSGRTRVLGVVSSTDPQLTAAAKKVAAGCLFTVPTYQGKAVKSVYYKTFNLKKP